MSLRHWIGVAALLAPGAAFAQPTLDSLWPNADGLRWEYEFSYTSVIEPAFATPATLWLDGTVQTAGGTAQVLRGEHLAPSKPFDGPALDPLLAAIWRARPDLRVAIEARTGASPAGTSVWWPLLLHSGYFMKNPTNIQMWQPDWDHPTWTYLTDDLTVGATFTHQLVPELADDVSLHGTVESIDASVTTADGTFEHAVRMGYVIDYGWSVATDEIGNVLGMYRGETRGHVHFVPGIGPVALIEDYVMFAEIDCSPNTCPQEWVDQLGEIVQTFALSLTRRPVAVAQASWSNVKSLYRQ
jgi:hypothetical protein